VLQIENFIYFFTVCGFFIGLIFSVVNFTAPSDILLYSGGITLFFYLFIHVVAINIIDFSRFGKNIFDKKGHEEMSDYFIKELDTRESKLDTMLLDLERMNRRYKKNRNFNNIGKSEDEYKKAA